MNTTALEAICIAAERGLPFLPLMKFQGEGAMYWQWWCPKLTRDGRCGDYENRPKLCRDYQAGDDRLCALRTNALTADLHVQRLAA
jgi:Fe-S-cluster containining protein